MAKADPPHIGPPPKDSFDRDRHPNRGADSQPGANDDSSPESGQASAQGMNVAHRQLHAMADNDLKQIPILRAGTRLEPGATYVDLRQPGGRPFTAHGDMVASHHNWYVPKAAVDYQLWNLLTGTDNSDRLGLAKER